MKMSTLCLSIVMICCQAIAAYPAHNDIHALPGAVMPDPVAELLETDRTWGEDPMSFSLEEILSFWVEDPMMIIPERGILQGKAAIKAYLTNNRADAHFSVGWTPSHAEVADSGDMGYTYGTRTITRTGSDGKPITISVPYLTVWKKQDGAWKCLIGK